jgi:DNA polymerase-3 subunit delta'
MSFDRVLDQTVPKRILSGALRKNLLASSYLFYGDEGTGKWLLALELAKAILCDDGQKAACDVCPSCRKIDKFIHPDVKLIFPVPSAKSDKSKRGEADSSGDPETETSVSGKSPDKVQKETDKFYSLKKEEPYAIVKFDRKVNIAVEQIRAMQKEIYLKPFEGKRKVVILSEAEKMHVSSANSLLKTLEEPPEDATMILTTSDVNQLLPTVVSRCQQVRFGKIPLPAIEKKLISDYGVEKEMATYIAFLSNGSYGRALDFLRGERQDIRREALELLQVATKGSTSRIVGTVGQLVNQWDRNSVLEMFDITQTILRDIYVSFEKPDRLINADMQAEVVKLRGSFKRQNKVEQVFQTMEQTRIDCQVRNVNLKLALLDVCFRIKRATGNGGNRPGKMV